MEAQQESNHLICSVCKHPRKNKIVRLLAEEQILTNYLFAFDDKLNEQLL